MTFHHFFGEISFQSALTWKILPACYTVKICIYVYAYLFAALFTDIQFFGKMLN